MGKIEVLLVDDQVLFVESLRVVLDSRADDIHVCGTALNGAEALEFVKTRQPDIILMDVRMPVMDGVEATKLIHALYPEIAIMMLTTFDDDSYVVEALNQGAVGYVLKDIPPTDLMTTVRAIHAGSIIISPQVANKLLRSRDSVDQAKRSGPAKNAPEGDVLKFLSKREIEVLKLIGEGHDNAGIAKLLCIVEQTVKNHVCVIYSKLNIHSRMKVMKLADSLKEYIVAD